MSDGISGPELKPPDKKEPAIDTDQQPSEQPTAKEIGGRKGPEPVRYGDWEKNGRCIDF